LEADIGKNEKEPQTLTCCFNYFHEGHSVLFMLSVRPFVVRSQSFVLMFGAGSGEVQAKHVVASDVNYILSHRSARARASRIEVKAKMCLSISCLAASRLAKSEGE
jgi:hypothetical protein